VQHDFRFRLQPLKSSPDIVLLSYLKSQGKASNDLVLRAIRAFWMPFAYQDCGEKQEQDLKLLAANMVFVLEDHANYLRTTFDLPRSMVEGKRW
jgi:hypothetical protein